MTPKLHLSALLIVFCISKLSYSQCSPVPQTSISGNKCIGSELRLISNRLPEYVIWTYAGNIVSTQTTTLTQQAVTVAGGNGQGINANQLNSPDRLYVDAAGVIYIPDLGNNRIQKWLPGATSGITVAGGNGTGAGANQFNRPTSVFADQQGNVYVTDQYNGRVQKWAPGASTGVTVAGLNHELIYPTDVFVDDNGNLYVSDQDRNVVLKYTPGSNTGVVVAGDYNYGSGATSLKAPTGIFVDANGTLYVCDTDNYRVQKWASGATSGTTVVSGYNPLDVSVDCNGNVFVADFINHRVMKYAPGSPGVVVAGGNGQGTGANQLNNPVGVFIVGNNNLFVADFSNHRVQRFSSSINNTSFTPTLPGNYTITVNYPCCPSYVESFEVNEAQQPQVNITATTISICPGDEVKFLAENTNNILNPIYQWKLNGVDVGSNADAYITTTLQNKDNLQCILTSNRSCTLPGSDTSEIIQMEVFDPVPLNLGKDFSICIGSDTLLEAPSIYVSYRWQDNSTQPELPINLAGKYYATVNDLCNRTFSDTIIVSYFKSITNFLPADTIICSYDLLMLKPEEKFSTYLWSNQSTAPFIMADQPGLYWLQAKDKNNCSVSDSVVIQTKTCPPKGIYVPNAFSPNNNGRNDIFKPVIYGVIRNYRFSVFNRYGQMVFNSSNPKQGWNGTINGNMPNAGVYVWYCKFELEGQKPRTEKGTVVLIK
jgi:gliding motility-associated-like protein